MCDIFYIAHLGVRYEIYPAHFPFDLRCQSGIYAAKHVSICTLHDMCPFVFRNSRIQQWIGKFLIHYLILLFQSH